ncbi:hypothetical protein KGF54_001261 [Candida jiufengensis]|uniref:uncharacterized protein n=1 Tax=Candida jiufengensis TaxID=497108 RepID=UPI00222545C9|nr:uncharacterized protein KGF54_001261 [Candida jiufengensis]KAI5955759.1 hypothetical protein KGF54_001261 [Candida jiufengensis]
MFTTTATTITDSSLNLYSDSFFNRFNMPDSNDHDQQYSGSNSNSQNNNNDINNNLNSGIQSFDENFNATTNLNYNSNNLNEDNAAIAYYNQYSIDNSNSNQTNSSSNYNYTSTSNDFNDNTRNVDELNSNELLNNLPLNNNLNNFNHQSINVNLGASPIDEMNLTNSEFSKLNNINIPNQLQQYQSNSNYNNPQQSYTSSSSLYSVHQQPNEFNYSNSNIMDSNNLYINDQLESPATALYQQQQQQHFQLSQQQLSSSSTFNNSLYDNSNYYQQLNNNLTTTISSPSTYSQNTMPQSIFFDNPNPLIFNNDNNQIINQPPSSIDPLSSIDDNQIEEQLSYNNNNIPKKRQNSIQKIKKSNSPKTKSKSTTKRPTPNPLKDSSKPNSNSSTFSSSSDVNPPSTKNSTSSSNSKKHVQSSSNIKNRYRVIRGVSAGGSSTRPPKEAMNNSDSIYLPVELNLIGASKEDICYPKWSKSEKLDRRRIVRIERLQQGSKLIVNFSIIGNANENPITLPSSPNIDVIEVSCLECEVDTSRYNKNKNKNDNSTEDNEYDSFSSDEENITNSPTTIKNEYEKLNINNPNNNNGNNYQYYITSVEVVEIVELLIGTEFKQPSEKRRERGRIRSNLVPFWCKKSISSRMNEFSTPNDQPSITLSSPPASTSGSTSGSISSNSNSKLSTSSLLSTNSLLSAPTSNQSSISSASSSSNQPPITSLSSISSNSSSLPNISKNQEYRMELAKRIMAYEIRKPRGFDKEVRILKWEKLIPALKRALHSYYTEIPQTDSHLF